MKSSMEPPYPVSKPDPNSGIRSIPTISVQNHQRNVQLDQVAVEEPLAIQATFGPVRSRQRRTVSVTMRTPGHDADLAIGLLVAEGLVTEPLQILEVIEPSTPNQIRVELHPDLSIDWAHLERRGFTSSSCGVCGKTTIDAITRHCPSHPRSGCVVPAATIHELPKKLAQAQAVFSQTGGLHAAALFSPQGDILRLREDVGRHNAVDKLFGSEFRAGRWPCTDRVLLVSARASFELIQKAGMAGVPIFAAIGAPSSLAIQLAEELGLTLLGFVRDHRFNIYTGAERISD